MQSIVNMNEQAALHIENGSYASALKVLDFAMDALNSVADHDGEEDEAGHQNASTASEIGPQQQQAAPKPYNESSAKSQTSKPLSPPQAITEDYEGDFIYTFPMRYEEEAEEAELDAMSMGVILTFNMALTHHLKAMMIMSNNNKRNSMVAFKCALKMYQLSFCLLLKGDAQLSVSQVLALTNNCGQIYKQLKREAKAKTFFTHMLSTLMTLIEGGDAEDIEHLDGFMWNASRFILADPEVAGAA